MTQYPSIDIESFHVMLMECQKIESFIVNGSTHIYLLKGTGSVMSRTKFIRVLPDNQVPYFPASGLAIILKIQEQYFKWLEDHRGWREGSYHT